MRKHLVTLAAIPAALIMALATEGRAQCSGMHSGGHSQHQTSGTEASKPIVYPIDYCIVSGEKLGEMGEPVKYEHEGRTLYFCCNGCVKKFKADPGKYLKKLDAAILAAAGASESVEKSTSPSTAAAVGKAAAADSLPWTLDWCVVSGDKLGEMGKPVSYKYKGREMTFCCKGCIKEFERDPVGYTARLDSALAGLITQPKPMDTTKSDVDHSHSGSHEH